MFFFFFLNLFIFTSGSVRLRPGRTTVMLARCQWYISFFYWVNVRFINVVSSEKPLTCLKSLLEQMAYLKIYSMLLFTLTLKPLKHLEWMNRNVNLINFFILVYFIYLFIAFLNKYWMLLQNDYHRLWLRSRSLIINEL